MLKIILLGWIAGIAVMDKTALESFVKTTYRMDIDKRKSVESLRQQAIGLVDQYGAA